MTKKTIVLGINAYHADASAAIFVNGHLIAAIEEERFTRIKHWSGFPIKAVAFCLKEAAVGMEEVDYIAIGRDTRAKLVKKLLYLAANPFVSIGAIKERLINRKNVGDITTPLSAHFGLSADSFKNKVKNIEHHRSHIASAFFASPFDEAACLSIDGSGDFSTTMTAIGKGNQIEVLDSVDFPHSLGLFYTAFTQYMGFPNYGDEYKVMGMAPYGTPKYLNQVRKTIRLTNDGAFRLNLSYFTKATSGIISYESHIPVVAPMFNEQFVSLFGPARKKGDTLEQFHLDLAASVQKVTEETIFHLLNHLHRQTGIDKVCIAGGVAQNSVANGKITRNTPFKKVYIPSAGHDAGISMGAALFVQHQLLQLPRQHITSAYTGSRFSNEEIASWLTAKGVQYQQLTDEQLYDLVTDCLINGGVVGWMQGRSEFGPRALGGRSILADPRRKDAKDILNLKIKRRESFRPFAPSILQERVAEFFELDEPVPFMEKVYPIKEAKKALIPAVTHVDGTGRLQSVDPSVAPKYYQLIKAFDQKTGVPILLNTSFNENEPIVNSPEDAYNCYHRTQMDMLVMENIVVSRDRLSNQ